MTIADCQISERPPLGGLSVLEGNYASVRFWQGGRMAELRRERCLVVRERGRECPLLARTGHAWVRCTCLLFDPKRTSVGTFFGRRLLQLLDDKKVTPMAKCRWDQSLGYPRAGKYPKATALECALTDETQFIRKPAAGKSPAR